MSRGVKRTALVPKAALVLGELVSKAKNTPLLGQPLVGRCVMTLVAGRVVHDRDGRLS